MSEWISIKDRLPESDKKVLITDGRNMMVSWYYKWNGMIRWVDTLYVRDITHWMPLPEPPKRDDTEYDRAGDDAESEVDAE